MRCLLKLTILIATISPTLAAAELEPLVRDHSFLIEEAWSSRPGVTQKVSIADFLDEATDYEHTADFAAGETHIFSVTVPVARMADFSEDPSHEAFGRSVGDLKLSYGLQLFESDHSRTSVAPSVSILIPTGNEAEGFGAGEYGAQLHVPLTVRFGARSTAYTDTELMFYRGMTDVRVAQKFSFLARPNMSVQLEAMYRGGNSTDRQIYVCPGLRWAIDTLKGVRLEPGVAIPIALTGEDESRLMVYLSLAIP